MRAWAHVESNVLVVSAGCILDVNIDPPFNSVYIIQSSARRGPRTPNHCCHKPVDPTQVDRRVRDPGSVVKKSNTTYSTASGSAHSHMSKTDAKCAQTASSTRHNVPEKIFRRGDLGPLSAIYLILKQMADRPLAAINGQLILLCS